MLEIGRWILDGLGAIGGSFWIQGQLDRKLKNRAFNRLFNIRPNEKLVIVCPSQSQLSVPPNVVTTHEDSMALAAIQSQVIEHGVPHKVKLHLHLDNKDKAEHLFLVCAPKSNSATRESLSYPSRQLPFVFSEVGGKWVIQDDRGHQTYAPSEPGRLDFAIIAKAANPWSSQERRTFVYIAAGIEGLGTWGAAYYLATRTDDLARKLRAERISSATAFVALIRSEGRGNYPPVPTLLEVRVL
ncbi:MAG: hypothetical protein ACE5JL_12390 [Dehalococcoidia bacterium]